MMSASSTVRLVAVVLWGVSLAWTSAARAQTPERYYPLDHRQPPGMAGRWATLTKPDVAGHFQPVRIALPTTGLVTFYAGSPSNEVVRAAPAQAAMAPGRVYRFRIAEMPGFPGVELFPTLELIDRLHAPGDLAEEFPVPVEITAEEIDLALADRMVTKVIYLEQPDLAAPFPQEGGIRTEELPPHANLLEAADLRGRPIAILRLGGRIPGPHGAPDEFFYSTPPLIVTTPEQAPSR